MSKHTPGPWYLKTSRNNPDYFPPMEDGEQFAWQITAVNPGDNPDEYGWAVAFGSSRDGEIVPSMHDLALIAAVPNLLEACKAMLEEHHIFLHDGQWWCPFCKAKCMEVLAFPHTDDCPVLAARAAIAKYEGTGA